jgi:hypothetical protein
VIDDFGSVSGFNRGLLQQLRRSLKIAFLERFEGLLITHWREEEKLLRFSSLEVLLSPAFGTRLFLGAIDTAAKENFVFICHLLLRIP